MFIPYTLNLSKRQIASPRGEKQEVNVEVTFGPVSAHFPSTADDSSTFSSLANSSCCMREGSQRKHLEEAIQWVVSSFPLLHKPAFTMPRSGLMCYFCVYKRVHPTEEIMTRKAAKKRFPLHHQSWNILSPDLVFQVCTNFKDVLLQLGLLQYWRLFKYYNLLYYRFTEKSRTLLRWLILTWFYLDLWVYWLWLQCKAHHGSKPVSSLCLVSKQSGVSCFTSV